MAKCYGKWRIIKDDLPEGGQAHTFLVVDSADGPCRVLKRLKNKKRIERFERELEIYLTLDHPHVLKVVDSDLEHDEPYIVFPYCSNGSLEDQDLSQYTISERLRRFSEICAGVGYAHSRGVIHRDLKPANILIDDDGSPVVADFGIAYLEEPGNRLTETNEVVGPRWYICPEHESGRFEEIAKRCDVYSLGKLLYWMIAGRVFARERHREPEYDLTDNGSSVELGLVYQYLFDRTITENPAERFADANLLRDEVERLITLLESRSRFYALAGIEIGNVRAGTYLTNFRASSIVSWQRLELGNGALIQGFAFSGDTLACWGVDNSADVSQLLLLSGRTLSNLTHQRVDVAGLVGHTTSPSHRRFRNLAFDTTGRPALAFTEGEIGERLLNRDYRLSAFMFDESQKSYQRYLIADHVGRSMGGEFAISNDGELAVFHPSDKGGSANPGVHPETIVRSKEELDRHPMGNGQTWAGPIMFDATGTLHQALVVELAGAPGHRELRYFKRNRDGKWSEETIVSARELSASIAMSIRSSGNPVVVAQAPDRDDAIAVFEPDRGRWRTKEFDLTSIAREHGADRLNTRAVVDSIIDRGDDLHVVLLIDLPLHLTSPAGSQGVLYLRFSRSVDLISHRGFPITRYLGFGIGSRDVARLCVEVA
jgi:serine/threonine protein kinase